MRKDFKDFHSGISGCCKDCEERHPACHDHCEKYRDAREKWETRKTIIKAAKDKEGLYTHYKHDKIRKERRKGVENGKRY